MDTLEFIVRLVDALSWPLLAAIVLVGFRRPISEFMASLGEISAFGLSAKRGDQEASRLLEGLASPADATIVGASEVAASATLAPEHVDHSREAFIQVARVERFSYDLAYSRLDALAKLAIQDLHDDACRVLGLAAYSQVLIYVRALELIARAQDVHPERPSYGGPYGYKSADALGAPEGLVRDLRDLKDFESKLEKKELRVTAEGVRKFILACRDTLVRLHGWNTGSEVEVKGILERDGRLESQ